MDPPFFMASVSAKVVLRCYLSYFFFFDRKLCESGPKRSFAVVLLLVVVGVETWVKNGTNQTKKVQGKKNVQANKKCAREQKMCKGTKSVLLWHIMVLNCRVWLVWLFLALCGLVWSCKALCGLVWLLLFTAMARCGVIRLSMALCDPVRPFYGLICILWSLMAEYT